MSITKCDSQLHEGIADFVYGSQKRYMVKSVKY